MLLSEILAQAESAPILFGIDVDTDLLTPPKGLKQAGLVYQGTATEPSDLFVDAVISCTLAGVDTIAEIEPGQDVDPKTLLTIAGNAGFSVAILPPSDQDGVEAWAERCAAFAEAYLQTPHFAGSLYPVSGFFGYLVARAVSGISALDATDPYVQQRFSEAIPEAWSNQAKAAMEAAWTAQAGGQAALDAILKATAAEAVRTALAIVDRNLAQAAGDAAEQHKG
jgi:predicted nucleic acid-binding protein